MPRTSTRKVDDPTVRVKKTVGKDDAEEQKKKRRTKTGRFAYEVKKISKKKGVVIQSQVKPLFDVALAHAAQNMIEAVKNINPEQATIKAKDAKYGVYYSIVANCHTGADLLPGLAKIHKNIEEVLRADKEAKATAAGK